MFKWRDLLARHSELSGKEELFKPKRDPSRKVHIHRAGQRPGGINDDETVEAPPPKSKKGDSRAALERARAKTGLGAIKENYRLFGSRRFDALSKSVAC